MSLLEQVNWIVAFLAAWKCVGGVEIYAQQILTAKLSVNQNHYGKFWNGLTGLKRVICSILEPIATSHLTKHVQWNGIIYLYFANNVCIMILPEKEQYVHLDNNAKYYLSITRVLNSIWQIVHPYALALFFLSNSLAKSRALFLSYKH